MSCMKFCYTRNRFRDQRVSLSDVNRHKSIAVAVAIAVPVLEIVICGKSNKFTDG